MFKVVLGTVKIAQIGDGVIKAKMQPLQCCSRAAQGQSSTNPVILYFYRTKPIGFYHKLHALINSCTRRRSAFTKEQGLNGCRHRMVEKTRPQGTFMAAEAV
jgi:hypothetical protein